MEKEKIRIIAKEQLFNFQKEGNYVERDYPERLLKTKKVVIITGVRRSGKSTLLKQISKEIENYAYFGFEDERLLDFTYRDFNTLLEVLLENKVDAFFFDEIQNIDGWEPFVRRLHNEGYKIFITGSNAKLLSSEIATALTGRSIRFELYPFSFKEYIRKKNRTFGRVLTTKERASISKYLSEYMNYGGFPEIVESKDIEELRELYQDILIKDIIVRHGIRNTKQFRELALYLLSNISNRISYNNLKNILSYKSTTVVKNHVDFMVGAFLFFLVAKFDYSVKKQIVNDKKVYAIDPGLYNIAFSFSDNTGKRMENIVFLELKRKGYSIFYDGNGFECDFLIREGIRIVDAIQVTKTLENTYKREVDGLLASMKKYNLKKGKIITLNEKRKIKTGKMNIDVIPLWEFLLE